MQNRIVRALLNPTQATRRLFEILRRKLTTREYAGASKIRSDSDDGLYVKAVLTALSDYRAFSDFKRHPDYNTVLEHLSEDEGGRYLALIQQQAPDLIQSIETLKENDLIGNPRCYAYATAGVISPTTLRYIKVASDLRRLFGDKLRGSSIVEIGVGYGGQALVSDRILGIAKYRLLDLAPVTQLAAKYLEHHILACAYRTSTLNQETGTDEFDLAISNYAFSELPAPLQTRYIEKVLSKSRRGYLTMNSGTGKSPRSVNKLSLEQLRKLLPDFEIMTDEPIVADENYIIVWGHR